MMLKIHNLDMAYSENTPAEACKRIAEQFGVVVELAVVANHSSGGWPTVHLIGTPEALLKALTSEGGWSCGDPADDAEQVYYAFKGATELFG